MKSEANKMSQMNAEQQRDAFFKSDDSNKNAEQNEVRLATSTSKSDKALTTNDSDDSIKPKTSEYSNEFVMISKKRKELETQLRE